MTPITLFRVLAIAGCLLMALTIPAVAAKGTTPDVAPSFHLPGRGADVVSDSLRGRVVVVDFWASWCEPCRRSFPWLGALQQKHAERGLTVVAINLDKARPPADAFLARYPAPFTIAFDPSGKTAAAYQVAGMPTTLVIGRDGRVLHRHIGFDPAKTSDFEKLVEEALAR